VRRLEDARWYVVRNAVNVLRYSRHPRSLDLMAQAARHAAEGVRREAVFGLAAGGEAAAPYLGALAVGPDASVRLLAIQALSGLAAPEAATALSATVTGSRDVETRRLALDALADHPSEEAASALWAFSRRSRPRLPRSLRRRAQALIRARTGDRR
jgi:HEAT repeat protein